jgi:hypothetical protein
MTDQDGKPLVDPYGKTRSQKLDGESPRTIAARMTRAIASGSQRSAFNRPLNYPKIGLA